MDRIKKFLLMFVAAWCVLSALVAAVTVFVHIFIFVALHHGIYGTFLLSITFFALVFAATNVEQHRRIPEPPASRFPTDDAP